MGTRLGQPAAQLEGEGALKPSVRPRTQKRHWRGEGLCPHFTGQKTEAREGKALAPNPQTKVPGPTGKPDC